MKRILAALTILFLASCALAYEKYTPETSNEKLVQLEYTYQGTLWTIDSMVNSGFLKGESAEKAADLLEQTSIAVNTARASVRAGGDDIAAKISAANSIILQLIMFLESKKGNQTSWQPETSFSPSRDCPCSSTPYPSQPSPPKRLTRPLGEQEAKAGMSLMRSWQ